MFVVEILLHRTRADQVVPIYEEMIEAFPTIAALAQARESEVKRIMHPLGLFWRATLLHEAAKEIVERFGGEIPDDMDALKSLPGISTYIASAVRTFAFGRPEAILDTNTVRIVGRVFGERVTDGSRRNSRFERHYRSLLSTKYPRDFNSAMIDLGAALCRPKNPRCEICPVRMMCAHGTAGRIGPHLDSGG